jgi:hypothetical protein
VRVRAQTTDHEQHQQPAQAPHEMKMGTWRCRPLNMDEMAAKQKANTERIATLWRR